MRFFINWRAYPFSRLFFATRTSAPPFPAPLFCPVSVVLFLSCFSLRFPIGLCSLHWSQGFCTVSIFVHLAIVSLLPLFYLPFPCSVWHALSLASSFPIRLATSLCLSAVSPCPSFPRLYKRPISALLRLPPCPAFFCSPILVPSTLFRFATFAEHCHTAAYPRSPAVLFLSSCPAAFALFIGRRVSAPNLVRLASVSFLFCLFPRSVSVVSFWHALSLASRFPIRPATSLCLSAVSPCPSFPRLYKRPISALLRLPPCPAIFCFPILAPSPLFCLFAKHCHTISCPRSPAVVFSPLVRPFLLSLSIAGFPPQTLSALLLFCLTDAFPICSLLIPPFKALFFLVCIFVSRAASHYTFPKTNCRLATLTAAPVCFYPFSFFSHALFFLARLSCFAVSQ